MKKLILKKVYQEVWCKDGRKITDAEGYLLDEKGEILKKGLVSKGFDYVKGKGKSLLNNIYNSFNDSSQKTKNYNTYEDNRNTDNHTKQEKTNSHSKTPFNEIVNYNEIVNDNKNPVNNLDDIAHYEEMERKQLFEEELSKTTSNIFSGEVAFKLYDTYGFPLDLTEDMLREKNKRVDLESFNSLMKEQKEKARAN